MSIQRKLNRRELLASLVGAAVLPAVVPTVLQPAALAGADREFLETRAFKVDEVVRVFAVPSLRVISASGSTIGWLGEDGGGTGTVIFDNLTKEICRRQLPLER